ncbi:antibiotic biosynthesis monooxygenase [Bowmanella sp. Y26]|uniref:antibiotic biosynthesis monooxygenase family protein n=1 Tax=Bowmanella yangjiangensis TaxID=2811230 RepID=UPI001BDBE4DF|nr:antibiotic biosynthesis monooxygenase family protein [Bowmanella yangjiangensis]MBT1063077.1 antibiotic biosynthesis monooxygenase [Bowmanella yangjiangensis]
MASLFPANQLFTQINVFRVTPENQKRLVEFLTRTTEDEVRAMPGFVSASLHQSLDGQSVTLLAKWQSALAGWEESNALLPCFNQALEFASLESAVHKPVRYFEPQELQVMVLSEPLRRLSGRRLN